MTINWPTTPSAGDKVEGPRGEVWTWDDLKERWRSIAGEVEEAPPAVIVSPTAPTNPAPNQLWFDSTDGRLFLWFDSQWVEITGGAEGGANVSTGILPPADPKVGDLWFDPVEGQLYIWFDDGTSTQWVVTINQPGGGSGGVNVGVLPLTPTDLSGVGIVFTNNNSFCHQIGRMVSIAIEFRIPSNSGITFLAGINGAPQPSHTYVMVGVSGAYNAPVILRLNPATPSPTLTVFDRTGSQLASSQVQNAYLYASTVYFTD